MWGWLLLAFETLCLLLRGVGCSVANFCLLQGFMWITGGFLGCLRLCGVSVMVVLLDVYLDLLILGFLCFFVCCRLGLVCTG